MSYTREDFSDWHVDQLAGKAGRSYIMRNHYSATCHMGPMCWGLFQHIGPIPYAPQLRGVIAFATSCSEAARGVVFGPEHVSRVTELHRMHLLDGHPRNATTFFIARALAGLKAYKPQYDAVLSYADTSEGHTGEVYRAAGALYLGVNGRKRKFYLDQEGRLRHPRQCGKNITLAEAAARGWTEVWRGEKHRWLFLLAPPGLSSRQRRKHKADLLAELACEVLPFPKPEPKPEPPKEHIMSRFAKFRAAAQRASLPPLPEDAHTPLTGPGKDAFVASYKAKMAEARETPEPKCLAECWAETFAETPEPDTAEMLTKAREALKYETTRPVGDRPYDHTMRLLEEMKAPSPAPERKTAVAWATTFEGARAQALERIAEAEANPPAPSTGPHKKSLITLLCEAERVDADDYHAFDDVSKLMPGLYDGPDLPAAVLSPESRPALGNLPPEQKTVEGLGLNKGTVKALLREGLTALSDLLALGEGHTWQDIPGVGPKAAEDVRAAIRANAPAPVNAPGQRAAEEVTYRVETMPPIIVVVESAASSTHLLTPSGWNVVCADAVAWDAGPAVAAEIVKLCAGAPTMLKLRVMSQQLIDLITSMGGVVIDNQEPPF